MPAGQVFHGNQWWVRRNITSSRIMTRLKITPSLWLQIHAVIVAYSTVTRMMIIPFVAAGLNLHLWTFLKYMQGKYYRFDWFPGPVYIATRFKRWLIVLAMPEALINARLKLCTEEYWYAGGMAYWRYTDYAWCTTHLSESARGPMKAVIQEDKQPVISRLLRTD